MIATGLDIDMVLLHLANARFGDYYAGMFHVLSAIEYLLPLLSLGLIAGQQGAKASRLMLTSFLSGLFLGMISGFPMKEYGLFSYLCIASFILFGGLVALQLKLSLKVAVTLASYLGILIGMANGAAWERAISPLNYSAGVISTALVLVIMLTGLVIAMEKSWQRIAVRIVGSWIAAIGIMYTPYIIMSSL